MIRIETSRQTVVTFKTEKAALNRVAKDAEWFANAAEAGEQGVVEVRAAYDAEQGRTLFHVDYVVYTEVAATDVPEGAQGTVTGTRRNHLGQAVPYGYAATVVAVHAPTGRLRLLNYTGTLVQREDEVLTLLPGSLDAAPPVDPRGTLQASLLDDEPVTDLHLEDGSCCEEDDEDALGECPACGGTTYHDGERRTCQDCSWASWAPAAPRSSERSSSSSEWSLVVGGRPAVPYADLPEALDAWRNVLAAEPLADIRVLHNGEVYADVEEHDTCTVHRDAVFSKDGPCPVCVEFADLMGEDTQAGGWRDAFHADLQQHTVDTLRALLDPANERLAHVLLAEERAALSTAIAVLEG